MARPGEPQVLAFGVPRRGTLKLLWPAWAYRVVAPALTEHGLDLFERTVLALCRAGVRDPARMGPLLDLDEKLCAHIVARAQDGGLLDDRRAPTAAGMDALRHGTAVDAPQWQVRYVFQDPFRLMLWPRTVDRLEESGSVRRPPGGEVAGAAGEVHVVDFPAVRPQQPAPLEVIEAASAGLEARRAAAREVARSTLAATDQAGREDRSDLRQVSFLHAGMPVHLLCQVDLDGDQWTAYDPFGLGTSELLLTMIRERARADESLRDVLAARSEQARAAEKSAAAGDRTRRRQRLALRLVRDIGDDLRADGDALRLATDLEEEYETADPLDGDRSTEAVVRHCHRLWEVLLRRLASRYPLALAMATDHAKQPLALRRAFLEGIAAQFGYDQAGPGVAAPDRRKLENVVTNPLTCNLRELLAGNLLVAVREPAHPLRHLASAYPDLLIILPDILNALRNRGTHGAPEPGPQDDIDWCRQLGLTAVRLLLTVPAPDPAEEQNPKPDPKGNPA